jgi:hypothetical protein
MEPTTAAAPAPAGAMIEIPLDSAGAGAAEAGGQQGQASPPRGRGVSRAVADILTLSNKPVKTTLAGCKLAGVLGGLWGGGSVDREGLACPGCVIGRTRPAPAHTLKHIHTNPINHPPTRPINRPTTTHLSHQLLSTNQITTQITNPHHNRLPPPLFHLSAPRRRLPPLLGLLPHALGRAFLR